MSKGKISVVIKNAAPPANDKLLQQWQKKVENSLTTRLLVPRLLSQSHVRSINEPSFFFISFQFLVPVYSPPVVQRLIIHLLPLM